MRGALSTGREGAPAGVRPARVRLLRALPEVFVGADAREGLDGRRGLLYGQKRHRQVDVLGFEPASGEGAGLRGLVERRLDLGDLSGWRVVGVAVTATDPVEHEELLLEGLVAGDVVLAGKGAARVLVHRGDALSPAPGGSRRRARQPSPAEAASRKES